MGAFKVYNEQTAQWELVPVGVPGYAGSFGYTGSQGAGYTGSQGGTGFTGSQGNSGFTGSIGAASAIGYTGSAGSTTLAVTSTISTITLANSDNGTLISTNANVSISNNTVTPGFNVTIFNNSTSNVSIIPNPGAILYWAGTSNTGTRTLLQRGLATVICVQGSNTFTISGNLV